MDHGRCVDGGAGWCWRGGELLLLAPEVREVGAERGEVLAVGFGGGVERGVEQGGDGVPEVFVHQAFGWGFARCGAW